MNPAAIQLELERLYEELTEQIDVLAKLAEEAAYARADYKIEFAKALHAAEGSSQDKREAEATIKTDTEFSIYLLAEARYTAQKERLAAMRSQLDALRTLSADARTVTG